MEYSIRGGHGPRWALALSVSALMLWATGAQAQLDKKMEALQEALHHVYDGQPVTLQECLRAAEAGSANLGVFEENLYGAHSDRLAAQGQWIPDLTLGYSWNRSERTDFDVPDFSDPSSLLLFAGAPLTAVDVNDQLVFITDQNGDQLFDPVFGTTAETSTLTAQTFQSLSLTSNWTVFDGFARSARIKASGANVRAREADLGWQKRTLVEQVSEAFFNLARTKAQVTVAAESEDVALKELERSQTYFDLGIATRSDVLQAKVQHQQTRLETVRARNNERQAFVVLTHSMNISGAPRFEISLDVNTDISGELVPELGDLLQQGRAGRLDLVAATQDVEATVHRVTEAKAGFWPFVGVFGQAAWAFNQTPFRFGAERNRTYGWGARVNWNVFDRFTTVNRTRNAVATKRRAEYQLRQAQLSAENEISLFLNNLIEAKESYTVATETVGQAQEDLRLANERFRVGAGTSLDVINAQRNLAQARTDQVNSVADFYIAQAKIARATGQ